LIKGEPDPVPAADPVPAWRPRPVPAWPPAWSHARRTPGPARSASSTLL